MSQYLSRLQRLGLPHYAYLFIHLIVYVVRVWTAYGCAFSFSQRKEQETKADIVDGLRRMDCIRYPVVFILRIKGFPGNGAGFYWACRDIGNCKTNIPEKIKQRKRLALLNANAPRKGVPKP
jgi:hypothetical protein